TVTALVTIHDYDKDFMVMATANGEVKKTPLPEFKEVRRNGKIAMSLDTGDELVAAKLVRDTDEVVMITTNGQAIRFNASELRSASRTSGGVRGISLAKGGKVVSLEVVTPASELFTITENGYGKRTPFEDYPPKHRGGQGVRNYEITKKTGTVVASRTVNAAQELIVISKDGIVIRTRMDSIRMTGRSAQGVSVINVGPGDSVAALATIDMGANGNGGGKPGGPDGGDDDDEAPEGEQTTLAGLEPGDGKPTKPTKPTSIKGRQRPQREASQQPPSPPRTKAPPRPSKAGPRSAKLKRGRPRR
ncbi:MAG TPA: DNA gyrase C-terminal beta-propeller domain-containing protein, partial [Dehalococcoidia bacterium]